MARSEERRVFRSGRNVGAVAVVCPLYHVGYGPFRRFRFDAALHSCAGIAILGLPWQDRKSVVSSDLVETSELSPWYVRFITLGTVLSGVFGLMPLFTPVLGSQFLGFHGTDVFLIRQAGAASLGYAVIGYLVVRYGGTWLDVRLSLIMALIFNGFRFIASVLSLFRG